MRKRIFGLALVVVMFFAVFGLVGCSNSHGIPSGNYSMTLESNEYIYTEKGTISFGWHIKGNNADYYVSGLRTHKSKIITIDEKVFFEGNLQGVAFKYEAIYDDLTKILTVLRP